MRTSMLLLFMCCFTSSTLIAQNQTKPNIIFILADDMGYGDVKALNPAGKIATPNIDRIAGSGVVFTNAHSSSAVCTPSRYSILTGRYPWRSTLQKGVLNGYSKPLITPEHKTVAAFLKQQGYKTDCVGKWHLGMDWALKPGTDTVTEMEKRVDFASKIENGPTTRGFDYYYGISASLDMPPYIYIENDHTVGIPTVSKKWVRAGMAEKDFEAVDVLPTLTNKACERIITQSKQKDPFFLYLALPSPHTPIVPGKQFEGKSNLTQYGDFVMETDWSVGQVLHTLDSLGIADNTLVIFTSDNGFAPYVLKTFDVEALGHYPSVNFRGYKADIWEGGHHVPLVARWPAKIKAGTITNKVVSLTDFMATCADIIEVPLEGNMGEDSYSMLKNERPAVISHSIDGNFCIQNDKWKLALCPGSGGWAAPRNKAAFEQGWPEIQLYDMVTDAAEKNNVAAAHPDVVKQLTEMLQNYVMNGKNEVKVDLRKRKQFTSNGN